MYNITIRIDYVPKLPNALSWNKWARHNEVKAWRMKIYRAFIGQCPSEPLQRARVIITRHGSRQPDKDNNYASVKPLVDSLKRNGIIFDDAPQFLDLTVQYSKCKREDSHTLIEIQELPVHD